MKKLTKINKQKHWLVDFMAIIYKNNEGYKTANLLMLVLCVTSWHSCEKPLYHFYDHKSITLQSPSSSLIFNIPAENKEPTCLTLKFSAQRKEGNSKLYTSSYIRLVTICITTTLSVILFRAVNYECENDDTVDALKLHPELWDHEY